MPKGPDYTEKDLFLWGGIIGGIVCTHLVLQPYGIHPLITFLGGVVIGVGIGSVLERAFVNWQAKQRRAREERKQDDLYGNSDNRHQW